MLNIQRQKTIQKKPIKDYSKYPYKAKIKLYFTQQKIKLCLFSYNFNNVNEWAEKLCLKMN